MPQVEFTLNGVRHVLDAAAVRTALAGRCAGRCPRALGGR